MDYLIPGQKYLGKLLHPLYPFFDEGDINGTNTIQNFGVITE